MSIQHSEDGIKLTDSSWFDRTLSQLADDLEYHRHELSEEARNYIFRAVSGRLVTDGEFLGNVCFALGREYQKSLDDESV